MNVTTHGTVAQRLITVSFCELGGLLVGAIAGYQVESVLGFVIWVDVIIGALLGALGGAVATFIVQAGPSKLRRLGFQRKQVFQWIVVGFCVFGVVIALFAAPIVRGLVNPVFALERMGCDVSPDSKTNLTAANAASVNCHRAQNVDGVLWYLHKLPRLERLFLTDSRVTDTGLKSLDGLTQLRLLDLDRTGLSDAGLTHLRNLTQLQWLRLDRTQITDAGLVHLRGMARLNELNLEGTLVTDAGVALLKTYLPHCRIVTDEFIYPAPDEPGWDVDRFRRLPKSN